MTLAAFFFIAVVVVVGYGVTLLLDLELTVEERLSYGTIAGTIVITVVGFLLSWWAGLTRSTVLITSLVCLVAVAPLYFKKWEATAYAWKDIPRRLRRPLTDPENPLPFIVLTVLGAIVTLRILGAAYVTTPEGGLSVGHLSTFGDWSAHLGYAASFAEAQNFPPELPTATGESFAYHFGVDFFSAMFMPLGVHVTDALAISSGVLAFAFPGVMYCATQRITGSRSAGVIAVLLFTLAGGTRGFDTFLFEEIRDHGWSTLFELRETYAFDGFDRQWVDNPITGFMYPQRPTQIGFPAVLMGVALLYSARPAARVVDHEPAGDSQWRTYLWVGVLIGIMPLFHIFAFGVLVIMAAWFATLQLPKVYRLGLLSAGWMAGVILVANQVLDTEAGASIAYPVVSSLLAVAAVGVLLPERDSRFAMAAGALVGLTGLLTVIIPVAAGAALLIYAVYNHAKHWLYLFLPAALIGLPLVIWQIPGRSGVADPNHTWWLLGIVVRANEVEGQVVPYDRSLGGFTSFWWSNTGLFLPLVLAAMAWFIYNAKTRSMGLALAPIWGLLIIPNVAILHHWVGNNVKYVVFFLLLGSVLIAAAMVQAAKKVPWTIPASVLLIFLLTLSGGLDVLRAASGEVQDENGVSWPVGYFNGGDMLVGQWVADNTAPDAVFVTAANNAHPVRALAGRSVISGSSGRLSDLGVDWVQRSEDTRTILGGFPGFDAIMVKYQVDYIVIGRDELNPDIGNGSNEFWEAAVPTVYDLGGYRIYDVRVLRGIYEADGVGQ